MDRLSARPKVEIVPSDWYGSAVTTVFESGATGENGFGNPKGEDLVIGLAHDVSTVITANRMV